MTNPRCITIYTWGYSTNRTRRDLRAALPERLPPQVRIIDVRYHRNSRNGVWFGANLDVEPRFWEGAYYQWLPALGNPERGPTWEPQNWQIAKGLLCHIAAEVLRMGVTPVLVCTERDAVRQGCHRVQVAEHLQDLLLHLEQEVEVRHL